MGKDLSEKWKVLCGTTNNNPGYIKELRKNKIRCKFWRFPLSIMAMLMGGQIKG